MGRLGDTKSAIKRRDLVGAQAFIGVNLREEVPIFIDEEPLSLDVADVQL